MDSVDVCYYLFIFAQLASVVGLPSPGLRLILN